MGAGQKTQGAGRQVKQRRSGGWGRGWGRRQGCPGRIGVHPRAGFISSLLRGRSAVGALPERPEGPDWRGGPLPCDAKRSRRRGRARPSRNMRGLTRGAGGPRLPGGVPQSWPGVQEPNRRRARLPHPSRALSPDPRRQPRRARPSLPSRCGGGRLRGRTDTCGAGEAPWPSESGIETDGRGGHYHSKDPMGAIQQIPY